MRSSAALESDLSAEARRGSDADRGVGVVPAVPSAFGLRFRRLDGSTGLGDRSAGGGARGASRKHRTYPVQRQTVASRTAAMAQIVRTIADTTGNTSTGRKP